MATYKSTPLETIYNDPTTGRYRSGQVAGIGGDDHRQMVSDFKDSFLNRLEAGLKQPVRVATATALPTNTMDGPGLVMTASANGILPAIDGVTLSVNDRVLVWLEADQKKNGTYRVTNMGSGSTPWVLTRDGDGDTTATLHASVVPTGPEGSAHKTTFFFQVTVNPTIGTSDIVYSVYTGALPGLFTTTADVTGAPIILDANSNADVIFNATGTISVNKTLQFNNASLGRRMKLLLTIASGAVLTLPSNVKFPGYQSWWNDGTKQLDFAQIGDGDFEIEFAYKTVGTYWQAKLHGPF